MLFKLQVGEYDALHSATYLWRMTERMQCETRDMMQWPESHMGMMQVGRSKRTARVHPYVAMLFH